MYAELSDRFKVDPTIWHYDVPWQWVQHLYSRLPALRAQESIRRVQELQVAMGGNEKAQEQFELWKREAEGLDLDKSSGPRLPSKLEWQLGMVSTGLTISPNQGNQDGGTGQSGTGERGT